MLETSNPNHEGRFQPQGTTAERELRLIIVGTATASAACRHRNSSQVLKALCGLHDALDLEQGPGAIDLYSLYHYLADLVRLDAWNTVTSVLDDLMVIWLQTMVEVQEERLEQVMH